MIETLSKIKEELFWKKCHSTPDKLHTALPTFTVAGTSHVV